jgi:hypothetical protein
MNRTIHMDYRFLHPAHACENPRFAVAGIRA